MKRTRRIRAYPSGWDINYPMSQLIERAALNTVMGLGIVFLTLLFKLADRKDSTLFRI